MLFSWDAWFKVGIVIGALSIVSPNEPLKTSLAFAGIGYVLTSSFVPRLSESFISIGLKGKDMSKRPPTREIPEAMGLIAAIIYLVLMILLIPFVFFKYLVSFSLLSNDSSMTDNYSDQYLSVINNKLFPHNKLAAYLSAVLCLQSTTLLGLFDDLFDIRWRHKFFLPTIASLPLLIVYYVDFSVTSIVIPNFVSYIPYGNLLLSFANEALRVCNLLASKLTGLSFSTLSTEYKISNVPPRLLDLGVFYYVYMSAVSVFAPNSINILAGINGLEVGQSVVLALIFILNDFCYLFSNEVSQAAHDSHMFSSILIIPFIGVSLGLLSHNWFPARAFVGDTYCYFSGMVFAIVGILGHFSKTLLLFLSPQIVNFLYSTPQIFGILPCPRHRLPKFNVNDGLLYPSFAKLDTYNALFLSILKCLEKVKLVKLRRDKQSKEIDAFSNMTIINLSLVWFGPMREDRLCMLLLVSQLFVGILMILVRHTVGPWVFGYDNLTFGVK